MKSDQIMIDAAISAIEPLPGYRRIEILDSIKELFGIFLERIAAHSPLLLLKMRTYLEAVAISLLGSTLDLPRLVILRASIV